MILQKIFQKNDFEKYPENGVFGVFDYILELFGAYTD